MDNKNIKTEKSFNFTEKYQKFKIRISFLVFRDYFKCENDLNNFVAEISKEKQEKFFKLSKFYNDFIRNPLFKDENTKNFFSLIMIFSLMEATMSEEKYKTFDEYLIEKFEPIPNEETLKQVKEKYLSEFGASRKVKKFFNDYADCDCKKIFAYAICDELRDGLSENENIEQNIKLFYDWRSKFVHNAEIHGAFQESSFLTKNKKTFFTSGYQRKDFEQLFEHGFLKYFGYKKNFEHKDTKEKIERYKKHTIPKVCEKLFKNFKNLKKYLKTI